MLSIAWESGSTSVNSPANPAQRRLRATTAPTELGREVAPIRATDRASNILSRSRTDIGFYGLLVFRRIRIVHPPRQLPSSVGKSLEPRPPLGPAFRRCDKFFRPLLNRVPDAGLSIPRPTVVLYMTV